MSQFTSGFWDLYIGVVTIVAIVACGVFLKSQSVKRVAAEHAGGKTETTGHVWDEDLGEYNNPLPRWWAWLFYLTIIFSLGYLWLYPGLGSYKGSLGWTQLKQLEDENAAAQAQFGPLYDKFAKMDVPALAKTPEAVAIGQKIFLNNCAPCHGALADGHGPGPVGLRPPPANLAGPDVVPRHPDGWLFWRISNGKRGTAMPPFAFSLNEQERWAIVAWLRSLPRGGDATAPAAWYPDPSGRFELRYWNGSAWTEHVSRNGQQFTDPPVA